MRNQLFLCIVIAIYLRGMHLAKKATPKDVAVLLFFVYAFYHSFKVENLSAADGFTTDIDKEAYTNLHKIVSELYKNDTLTIPGHVHIQGNLQVGDKGDLNVGDAVAGENKGVIYGQWVRATHHQPNKKINATTMNLNGATDINLTGHVFCHKGVNVTNTITTNEVHTGNVIIKSDLTVLGKATFENAVLMPWTMNHNEAYIGDNWMKNMKSTTRGSLYREKDGRDLRIVK